MSNNHNDDYKVGYGKPPKSTQFGAENGNKPNRKGRKKKPKSTFQDEMMRVYGAPMEVIFEGRKVKASLREVILMQMAREAMKQKTPSMYRTIAPFLKAMDDAPEFEALPEDEEMLKRFKLNFNADGSMKE